MTAANAPKTQLGRYQLVRHLASGGMTDLWLANSPHDHVAIRCVRSEQARDRRFVQAFLDDVRAASALRHPNIAAVHEAGQERGQYFLAMEWVHGADLRRILTHASTHDQQLPVEHVMTIALALASALQHAHAHGIVHGAVAPSNILVGYDGHVKLTDFGLANAAHRTRETQPGVMKGKVSYMAPEQCAGHGIDRRSDVFALGIVLYELVTVRRLFKAPNDFLAMTAILHGEIPPPSTSRAGLAPELDAIILKALEVDPRLRFQHVDDMRVALERFCAASHVRTSPALLADYLRKTFGKHPEPWLVDATPPLPIDFDGARPGIVAIPEAISLQQPPPTTPADGDEATDIVAPLPLDLLEGRLAVGDATMLVRPAPVAARRRTPLLIAALVGVAAIAAALVVIYAQGGDPRLRTNPNIELPPPSSPAPVAIPPPAPDAAPVDEVVDEVAEEVIEEVIEEVVAPVVAKPPPPIKKATVQKKKQKKKLKRPQRRPRKAPEASWDRD